MGKPLFLPNVKTGGVTATTASDHWTKTSLSMEDECENEDEDEDELKIDEEESKMLPAEDPSTRK